MSLTNPKDFLTLWSLIPKNKRKNVWFFSIRQNKKNPDVPSGTVLKGNMAYRLDFNEALHRMKWGSNVGIYALQGGLCFLDIDTMDGKLKASQSFLDALGLNPTLTIKTRNNGIQKYFWNTGAYKNSTIEEYLFEFKSIELICSQIQDVYDVLPDRAYFSNKEKTSINIEFGTEEQVRQDESRTHTLIVIGSKVYITIGEFRGDWYYVVSVGSHVEPDFNCRGEQDGTYRIIEERPISDFKGFGEYFKKNEEVKKEELKTFSKKTDSGAIQLEEYLKNIEQKGKHRREASIFERKFLLNRIRLE